MNKSDIIPFYGGKHPELFEIERRCMDREGKVIEYLQDCLPDGTVLDIGAGNGFTAEKLTTVHRLVIPMEPDEKMIDLDKKLPWSKGTAQTIPFHDDTFDAAYATWAFFFDGVEDFDKGLKEAQRVVKNGGSLIFIDNYGNDEFCALSPSNISSRVESWTKRGFQHHIIETAFIFDSIEEARKLLTFYFGDAAKEVDKRIIEYKVVAYTKMNNK
ncbi:MAG TPA: class I SAM-dependent methyltransferase [Bacillaceae bacterium]